jgi:hypothetical protein
MASALGLFDFLNVESKIFDSGSNSDFAVVRKVFGQDQLTQLRRDLFLDISAERASTVQGIERFSEGKIDGRLSDFHFNVAILETVGKIFDLKFNDRSERELARTSQGLTYPKSSFVRGLNMTISSNLFKNSGEKWFFTSSITLARALADNLFPEEAVISERRCWAPKLDVMITTTLLKSTVTPCPSVKRPSSSNWRSTPKTSLWAFSTSSNKITE